MDIKFTCLIYSKYSDFSKKLLNIMETSGVDFVNIFKLKLLCADNENVRKTILKSKNLDIKNVPCILLIFEDGKIEKYDDNNAFNWVEEIIQKVNQQKQLEQEQLRQQQLQQEQIKQQQLLQQEQLRQQMEIQEQQKVQQTKKVQKNININKNKKNLNHKATKKTSIDDLEFEDNENDNLNVEEDEEENDNEEENKEIETIDDEEDNLEDSEIEVKKMIKKQENRQKEKPNALTIKKNDLMALAASMQKGREKLDSKIPKSVIV